MKLWADGRDAVRNASAPADKLETANDGVGRILRALCDRVLREDPEVLKRPAGGASAGYSIASGMKKQGADRPIQPVGLTGPAEAAAFVKRVNEELERQGGAAHFWYPPRDVGDLCEGLEHGDELPAALQCTPQEIEWAMTGSDEVDTLWIPPRAPP